MFLYSFLSACEIENKNVELIEGEDISTSEINELIGIWTYSPKDDKQPGAMQAGTYQFNEDGTCAVAQVFLVNGVNKLEYGKEGNCYLNSSRTKIRIEKETDTKIEWNDFGMDINTIYIDNRPYNKVVK